MLGVACLLHLVVSLLCESNGDYSQVAVSGLHINISLNQSLPFLDHGAELVTSKGHAMEVGQQVASLNLLANQLEFTESDFIVLEISQADFKDSSL